MKLAVITIIQRCNKDCRYCSMKQWMPKNDELDWKIWANYIKKHLDPKEWFIRITGGEPSIYSGINELIASLSNYQGIIETNGSNKIEGHFPCFSMWHENQPFPEHYNIIGILSGTENWQAKEEHCKTNNIPYLVTELRAGYGERIGHEYDYETVMWRDADMFTDKCFFYSSGDILPCPGFVNTVGNIKNDDPPKLAGHNNRTCPHYTTIRKLAHYKLLEIKVL